MEQVKLLLLCSAQANQKALANKLAGKFLLKGIIIEQKPGKRKGPKKYLEALLDHTLFANIRNSWQGMLQFYNERYPDYPTPNILRVSQINSAETIEFIKQAGVDMLVVSGTGIIKSDILCLPLKSGIVNLHTGLSPYVKGGPNCTNWCVSTGRFEMIGNTVMWIDKGIDTGDIIATERIDLTGVQNLSQLHLAVMEHAHDLYCRAIEKIVVDNGSVKTISQNSLGNGTTYYTKNWQWPQKWALIKNFPKFIKWKSGTMADRPLPKTVEL